MADRPDSDSGPAEAETAQSVYRQPDRRHPVDRAVNRKEVEALLQRFHALPRAAQLTLFTEMRTYLGIEEVPETEDDRQIRQRAESLQVMAQVAQHHQLSDGTAPTATQWRQAPKMVTAGWSATRMAELWGRYRFAQMAYKGEKLSTGAARRGQKRQTVHRRSSFEDELQGLARWLDSKPVSFTTRDYDEYVAEQNDAVARGRTDAKRLRKAAHVAQRLGVPFENVLAVVRDGADLGQLRAARQKELLQAPKGTPEGALGLISARQAAALLGHVGNPNELVNQPDFPTPVLELGGNRGWLKNDIEAIRDGQPPPQRAANELQDQVIGTTQMAQLRGYPNSASVIALLHRSSHMLPKPDGRLDNTIYWLTTTVQEWLPTAPPRRGRRPDKEQHAPAERAE